MKMYRNILRLFLLALFIFSCSSFRPNLDDRYQPLGTAVLAANDLLMVKYPQGPPENIHEDEYKGLLKEDYKPMYVRLLPYLVQIEKMDNYFIVSVFDGKKLILTDWSCTEGRIDCWCYNRECNPDALKVECDQ